MKPVLKYAGAKWRIADWIIGHLPAHSAYCEPFFGSGAIYFNKPVANIEIINDLDGEVVNLFRVLRESPLELAQLIALTPWAQSEYNSNFESLQCNLEASSLEQRLERARNFLSASWQMFGRKHIKAKNGWRFRYLSSQSPLATWNKLPDRILWAAERLMHTQISNDPAHAVIAGCNDSSVLIYCDPPYLGSTRTHGKMYTHEMKSETAHLALLEQLDAHQGMVAISGYPSALYASRLRHWTAFETVARSQSNRRAIEVLWLNPLAAKNLGKPTQAQMFEVMQ
jgi:DNA adenine methylase